MNVGPALLDKLTLTENRIKTIEEQVKTGKQGSARPDERELSEGLYGKSSRP